MQEAPSNTHGLNDKCSPQVFGNMDYYATVRSAQRRRLVYTCPATHWHSCTWTLTPSTFQPDHHIKDKTFSTQVRGVESTKQRWEVPAFNKISEDRLSPEILDASPFRTPWLHKEVLKVTRFCRTIFVRSHQHPLNLALCILLSFLSLCYQRVMVSIVRENSWDKLLRTQNHYLKLDKEITRLVIYETTTAVRRRGEASRR